MIIAKKIKELNFSDQLYYIPSYQRGYRWEDTQVNELLDDIYEIYATEQESYCLQPIVVSEIEKNKYEIIDGQQRLTTIYILLTYLKSSDQKFRLDFEIRKNCIDFFENLSTGILDYSNPDFAHISNAYSVINRWFDKKKDLKKEANVESNVLNTLLEKVEVIWYDVEQTDRHELIKIFTRLNSGKIPLTNAELIKVLFLSKANYINRPQDVTSQLDISNKWNQIEYALQDTDFWYFINRAENNISTRIDYILQLLVKNKGYEVRTDLDVFKYYYPLYVTAQQSKSYDFVESNWDEIEGYFSILQDWFLNHKYFHLTGLLIWDGADILDLIKNYQKSNKKAFLSYLFKNIESRFCSEDLSEVSYNKRESVERILVFFNVMEAYLSSTYKFPFKQLKLKQIKWSLEHIHPQNAMDVKPSEYLQWLTDHLQVVNHMNDETRFNSLVEEVTNLITDIEESKNIKDLKLRFESISDKVLNILTYNEHNKESNGPKSKIPFVKLADEHHLSNMALLDTKRNSSLGNSAFALKRKAIIDFESKGIYIPIATKNSFLKYYSDYPRHLNYWTLEDRDEYISKIQQRIDFVKNFQPTPHE